MQFISNLSAIVLLTLITLTGCTQTATSQQNAQSNVAKAAMSVPPQPKAETEDDMKRISVEEAKAAFDAGKAFFIDTRDAEAYKAEHIKGAVNIMANDIESRYKQLPTDKQIIAYCSWPNEHTSARAVLILKQNGITNAAALLGGTKAWKDKGYPMESSQPQKK